MQVFYRLNALIRPVGAGLVHGKRGPYRIIGQYDFRRQLLQRYRSPGNFRRRCETGQADRCAPGRPVIGTFAVIQIVDGRGVCIPGAHISKEQPKRPIRLPKQTCVQFLPACQHTGDGKFRGQAPGPAGYGSRCFIQFAPRRPVKRPEHGSRAAAEGGFLQPRSIHGQGQAVSCRSCCERGQRERSVISDRSRLGAGNGSTAVAHPCAGSFIGSRRDRAAQVLGADLPAQRVDLDFVRYRRGR